MSRSQRERVQGQGRSPGDAVDSLGALYARHRDEVLTFVKGKVGSGPPDPEDIVQQTFANFAARDDRKTIDRPIAFLVRSAHNLITDYFRAAAHRRYVSVDDGDLDQVIEDRDELSPEIVVLGRERLGCVTAALERLPRRRRRFVLLSRIEGLSYTEIARQNGVSISTSRPDRSVRSLSRRPIPWSAFSVPRSTCP